MAVLPHLKRHLLSSTDKRNMSKRVLRFRVVSPLAQTKRIEGNSDCGISISRIINVHNKSRLLAHLYLHNHWNVAGLIPHILLRRLKRPPHALILACIFSKLILSLLYDILVYLLIFVEARRAWKLAGNVKITNGNMTV